MAIANAGFSFPPDALTEISKTHPDRVLQFIEKVEAAQVAQATRELDHSERRLRLDEQRLDLHHKDRADSRRTGLYLVGMVLGAGLLLAFSFLGYAAYAGDTEFIKEIAVAISLLLGGAGGATGAASALNRNQSPPPKSPT
jgi:hypothetical protein